MNEWQEHEVDTVKDLPHGQRLHTQSQESIFARPLTVNNKMKTGLFAILNTAITKNFSNNDKRVTVLTADSSKEHKNMRKGKPNLF